MLLLGGEPGHRRLVDHAVRDEDPPRTERAQDAGLRDVRDGETPRAPPRLLGGELRRHCRLHVRGEVEPAAGAQVRVPVEVRREREAVECRDRRGEPVDRHPPIHQVVHCGHVGRQALVPPVERLGTQPFDGCEVDQRLGHVGQSGSAATTSISTRMPCSCEPTVVRTGYGAGNMRSYTAL